MNRIDETATINSGSNIGNNVSIYKNVRVLNSILVGNNSIGDFFLCGDIRTKEC